MDPESFVREGLTFNNVFFQLMRGGRIQAEYHYKRAIIDPPAKRHLNGVFAGMSMMVQLGSFVIFRRSGPVLLRNLFVIFQGDPDP